MTTDMKNKNLRKDVVSVLDEISYLGKIGELDGTNLSFLKKGVKSALLSGSTGNLREYVTRRQAVSDHPERYQKLLHYI